MKATWQQEVFTVTTNGEKQNGLIISGWFYPVLGAVAGEKLTVKENKGVYLIMPPNSKDFYNNWVSLKGGRAV